MMIHRVPFVLLLAGLLASSAMAEDVSSTLNAAARNASCLIEANRIIKLSSRYRAFWPRSPCGVGEGSGKIRSLRR